MVSMNLITSWFTSWALKMASIMVCSGTSLAPASIMITFSRVEATVRAISDTFLCAEVGFTMNSPSMRPICVMAQGPSKGISEIAVAMAEPSMAVSSGLHSGSTDITRLFKVTSFL